MKIYSWVCLKILCNISLWPRPTLDFSAPFSHQFIDRSRTKQQDEPFGQEWGEEILTEIFGFSKRPKLTSSSNKLAWTCTGGLLKYLSWGENNYENLSNIFVWLGHSKLISRLTGDCMKTLGRSVGIIKIIILELVYVWDTELSAQKHGLYDINAFAWHLIVFKRTPVNPSSY